MSDNCSQTVQYTLDDLSLWNVESLKYFCKQFGLSISKKRKDELISLAYSAQVMGITPIVNEKFKQHQKQQDYNNLLAISKKENIPDPMSFLLEIWLNENESVSIWPDISKQNIIKFLGERNFSKCYKYLASGFVKEMYFLKWKLYCFLRTTCTPSKRINAVPHDI